MRFHIDYNYISGASKRWKRSNTHRSDQHTITDLSVTFSEWDTDLLVVSYFIKKIYISVYCSGAYYFMRAYRVITSETREPAHPSRHTQDDC